jgi:hypothetical protein
MRLYLRHDLLKSESDDKKSSTPSSKGEQRGGQYVARAQVGLNTDGTPKYRYFNSEEEYESFLANKGKTAGGKKLEDKVKKEHKESTEKQSHGTKHQPASRSHGLLSHDKPTAEKSLRLYLRIT